MQRTLVSLFRDSVGKYAALPLMLEKRNGEYKALSYRESEEQVRYTAAGLMALGLKKDDRVTLLAEGRNDWVICELAILYCGGINVPISIKLEEPEELKFRIEHSESSMIIVSKNQHHKIKDIKKDLPELNFVIIMDECETYDIDEVALSTVKEKGKQYLAQHEKEFNDCVDSIKESDYANICYTSGTTADPKGIILTHRNYTANIEQSVEIIKITSAYTTLLILPWDHSFAHTCGIYCIIAYGASFASVEIGKNPLETLKNIGQNIKEIKPYFLLSVPALAKNLRKSVEKGIQAKNQKIQKLFNMVLKIGYAYNKEGYNKGKGNSIFTKMLVKIFDKILFSKIRLQFGGKLKFFIGGGALLDIELQRFFYAIGVPMYQGYGLSETSPVVSSNNPQYHKLGSSGKIVKNLEVKICDESGRELPIGEKGEIVVKGENVMAGYWRNPKATSETLRNGWLYTGDMGYFDADNYLYVLGRFKSLLIGNDGEKYSPEGIEEAIVEKSRYIDQIILYNNQNPYTVALVVPNRELLLAKLKEMDLSPHTLDGQDAALSIIDREIAMFKENGIYAGMFPYRWLPASFAVLGEAFSEQNRFINSTMKMVRGRITEYYKPRIDHLYTAEAKDIYNKSNRHIIARME